VWIGEIDVTDGSEAVEKAPRMFRKHATKPLADQRRDFTLATR
jgi:hypothetical protein